MAYSICLERLSYSTIKIFHFFVSIYLKMTVHRRDFGAKFHHTYHKNMFTQSFFLSSYLSVIVSGNKNVDLHC